MSTVTTSGGTFTTTEPYPEKHVPPLLAETWRRYQNGETPAHTGPDGFPVYPDNPQRAEHELLSSFIRETHSEFYSEAKPEKVSAGRTVLALDDAAQIRFVFAAVERFPWFWKTGVKKVKTGWFGKGWEYSDPPWRWNLKPLLASLLRRNLPFSNEQFDTLLETLHEPPGEELLNLIPAKAILRLAQSRWQPGELPETTLAGLKRLQKLLKSQQVGAQADGRKLLAEFDLLLGKPQPPPVEQGEAWSDAALGDLRKMPAPESAAWGALLAHCATAESSKPAKRWLDSAKELVESVGQNDFKRRVLHWFELVALPRTSHRENPNPQWRPDPDQLICERNATVLRGLAWCCASWADAEISAALSRLAEVCFKKIRWLGPRCPRVGNACLYSLSTTSSKAAAAQLSRLDATVKQPTAKKRIDKSLDAAATLTGQSREDLEEKSVPSFGLGPDGKISRSFGDCAAELQVIRSRNVEVRWSKDGKVLKSVPPEIKRDHVDALKEFQKLGKDLEKMLAAQRIRVERLLMTGREWEFAPWRERYLDHPLMAGITRRLIWHFQLGEKKALGAWLDGRLVDVHDKPLNWLAPATRVHLWHPIGFPVETVAAWREWLRTHEVCQPFKQAHREIYVLTDAELGTRTYSNRFAAHLLGQHQFAALCAQRGWKYSFMGGFDFQATPTLDLPAWDMCAEFWVAPAGELADSGVALHLGTDQVRFVRANEPLPLTEVPAAVFSEVMRDVDLFVGVGSIGNDPAWRDQGNIEGGHDYWQSFSFGDLSATAQTRKAVLERLVPKLKIAGQCSFADKFLVVRGSQRTYKIHLGSGNILMTPNDQYLCIVPKQGTADDGKVVLPFEGDRTLSVILSKAFLLADDARIKDPTIVSQITGRKP